MRSKNKTKPKTTPGVCRDKQVRPEVALSKGSFTAEPRGLKSDPAIQGQNDPELLFVGKRRNLTELEARLSQGLRSVQLHSKSTPCVITLQGQSHTCQNLPDQPTSFRLFPSSHTCICFCVAVFSWTKGKSSFFVCKRAAWTTRHQSSTIQTKFPTPKIKGEGVKFYFWFRCN